MDLFEEKGYKKLAEQYSVGLIDLNTAEVEEIFDGDFLKFENVKYPKILSESFIISLPTLTEDEELDMQGSLALMIGAFPARYYSGLFSSKKNKIKKWPLKYSLHDIIRCKMPEFAVIDASAKGSILAGVPIEMDKQGAALLGKDWKAVGYLRLISDSIDNMAKRELAREQEKNLNQSAAQQKEDNEQEE